MKAGSCAYLEDAVADDVAQLHVVCLERDQELRRQLARRRQHLAADLRSIPTTVTHVCACLCELRFELQSSCSAFQVSGFEGVV